MKALKLATNASFLMEAKLQKALTYLVLCLVLGGCSMTFQSRDGYQTRMGFVWERKKPDLVNGFSYTDSRLAGLGLDFTSETGGLVLGYRSVETITVEKDSLLEVELGPQSRAVQFCVFERIPDYESEIVHSSEESYLDLSASTEM